MEVIMFNPFFVELFHEREYKKEKAENISFLISLFIGIIYSFWVYSYNVGFYIIPLLVALGATICVLIYKLISCLIIDLF